MPPYITGVRQDTNAPSSSESISYDYSGLDEIRKRQQQASELASGKWAQLYSGDIAGSVTSGQRIRSLLSSLNDIEPVRISSYSSNQDMGGGSSELTGSHDEPSQDRPNSQRRSYETTGVAGRKTPNKQRPPARASAMSHVLAGEPRIFPGMS
jgi:hypothetical protein